MKIHRIILCLSAVMSALSLLSCQSVPSGANGPVLLPPEQALQHARTNTADVERRTDQAIARADADIASLQRAIDQAGKRPDPVRGYLAPSAVDFYRNNALAYRSASIKYSDLAAAATLLAHISEDAAEKARWSALSRLHATEAARARDFSQRYAQEAARVASESADATTKP